MDWNNKIFNIFGLSNKEIAVLSSLVTYKNVQDLSKDSNISRTGVNHILNNLKEKGLINQKSSGKRCKYIAINEDELRDKISKITSMIELQNVNKKGVRVRISKKDEFVVHVGCEEIIPAYKRIAFENKNERICAIQHHRSWNELIEKISPEQLIDFNEAIKKNNLILDGMLNKSAYQSYKNEIKSDPKKNEEVVKSLEGRMADYTVFDDNFFNYNAEIWIFKTTTLIINWYDEVAIEITNSDMTSFIKDMFNFVKESGVKFDHNQAIKKVLNSNQ